MLQKARGQCFPNPPVCQTFPPLLVSVWRLTGCLMVFPRFGGKLVIHSHLFWSRSDIAEQPSDRMSDRLFKIWERLLLCHATTFFSRNSGNYRHQNRSGHRSMGQPSISRLRYQLCDWPTYPWHHMTPKTSLFFLRWRLKGVNEHKNRRGTPRQSS